MNSQHRLELINNKYEIYLCLLILHAYFPSKSSKIKLCLYVNSQERMIWSRNKSLNLAA